MSMPHIDIHAHERVNRPPKQRHHHHGQPKIAVQRERHIVSEMPRFNHFFPKSEQCDPSQGTRDPIQDEIAEPPAIPWLTVHGFWRVYFNRQNERI